MCIRVVYVCDSIPRHTYASGELIARGRGGKSLSFVRLYMRALARARSCVRAGDGTGDKRIGHARYTPVAVSAAYTRRIEQKQRPAACCHWLIRHDA